MEDAQGTHKIAITSGTNRVTVDHICKLLPFLIKVCGSSCSSGAAKHTLMTQYVRWREWIHDWEYEKVSASVRKRTKYLNRPFHPHPTNPNKVKDFFKERHGFK